MYVGRTRKKFSVCTLETLVAKREAGYTRHHKIYIQSVEKEVQILGQGQEKHAAWPAARFHNHATSIDTDYTEHSADGLQFYR